MPCPNCGAPVQVDANFCGQCGFNVQAIQAQVGDLPTSLEASSRSLQGGLLQANSEGGSEGSREGGREGNSTQAAASLNVPPSEPRSSSSDPVPGSSSSLSLKATPGQADQTGMEGRSLQDPDLGEALEPTALTAGAASPSGVSPELLPSPTSVTKKGSSAPPIKSSAATQLQRTRAVLLHLRTNVEVGIPENLSVIHIGKPNDRVPPDIDISGFPDSEVVSRVHADIRIEGDAYYIEDLNSSNGTYINNLPLAPGNRHRLRMGDRIALGKGDLVTFLFQVA